MSELIERLREGANDLTPWLLDEVDELSVNCALPAFLNEAAAEIERLTAEVAGLRKSRALDREALEAFLTAGGANPRIGKMGFSVWSLDRLGHAYGFVRARLAAGEGE